MNNEKTKILQFPGFGAKNTDTTGIESLLSDVAQTADLPCWDDELSRMIREAEALTQNVMKVSEEDLEMVKAAALDPSARLHLDQDDK